LRTRCQFRLVSSFGMSNILPPSILRDEHSQDTHPNERDRCWLWNMGSSIWRGDFGVDVTTFARTYDSDDAYARGAGSAARLLVPPVEM
jgi:hypothetical protein